MLQFLRASDRRAAATPLVGSRDDSCVVYGVATSDGIDQRLAVFQDDVIVFIGTILPVPGTRRTVEQLVAAAGSVNANRQEATSASSKKEFVRYNEIALRSAKESGVWLRACKAGKWGHQGTCDRLFDEAQQIARILAAIVISAKRGKGSSPPLP